MAGPNPAMIALRGRSLTFLLHHHRQRQRAEAAEGDKRIHGVRDLPLPAQLLPVRRNLGPVVGRLVGWKRESEENDEVRDQTAETDRNENESAPTAQRPGKREVGEQRAE